MLARGSTIAQEALRTMAPGTATELSVEQLRELANESERTLAQLPSVLLSLVGDDEERVQWASEALENCGAPKATQLNELLPFLKHDDRLVLSWSCKLIARMGRSASAAQGLLVDLLSGHKDTLVREEAARALGEQSELNSAARSALEQAAMDGGPRLKRLATAALSR